jgi:hypothetical protein
MFLLALKKLAIFSNLLVTLPGTYFFELTTSTWAQCYKTFYVHNLRMFVIAWGQCYKKISVRNLRTFIIS